MDPIERYEARYRIISVLLTFIGVAFFKDKHFNLRVGFCSFITFTGSASVFYTLWITRNNFALFLKCLCAGMQAVMGIVKLALFAKHKKRMENQFLLIDNTYELNIKSTLSRQRILIRTASQYKTIVKVLGSVYILILIVIIIYPIYAVLYFGKIELFFEIQFIGYPMSNADKFTYVLNFGAQLLEIFYAYQGTFVYDVVMFTFVFQIHVLTKLLEVSFKEVEKQTSNNKQDNVFHESLRNCLTLLQDINNNILELKEIFSAVIFFQITSSSVKLGLSLFCIVKTDWIGGYGFASLSFIEILMYSLLGTFLEETNQKLAKIIYDFKWYLISTAHQKMILFALMKSQRTATLAIGDVVPLNVQTAGSIYKTVYSYLMVLLNFAG